MSLPEPVDAGAVGARGDHRLSSVVGPDLHGEPSAAGIGRAYQFTPADAGTAFIQISFSQNIAYRLRVYDIANKAVAGVSAPFQVVGPPNLPGLICPASYH
jgi:hypothetical protein